MSIALRADFSTNACVLLLKHYCPDSNCCYFSLTSTSSQSSVHNTCCEFLVKKEGSFYFKPCFYKAICHNMLLVTADYLRAELDPKQVLCKLCMFNKPGKGD